MRGVGMTKHYEVSLEVSGPTAMWTRPDTGDAPVSYPGPTHSAAKGIFEAILWIQAVEVIPVKVEICSPIVFHTYVTNYGGPLRKSRVMKGGSSYQLLATVLVNVCYRLYAKVQSVPAGSRQFSDRTKAWAAGTSNPAHAYQEIFERRIRNGQCHSIPCLGWKEFVPSYVGPFRNDTSIQRDINLVVPSMASTVFTLGQKGRMVPTFMPRANVQVREGVLRYAQ